jgi:hypothetical protein
VIFAVMRERGLTGIATAEITDQAMERLSRLDFVTRVDFEGAQALSDAGLGLLSRMPQLEELVLGGWHDRVTDRGLEVLRHVPSLKRFSMGWAQRITDAGVAHLAFCDSLEQVNLMGTPTGDGLLSALLGKGHLRSLKTGKQITDAGIPLLHDLPGFRALATMPSLRGIAVSCERVDDGALSKLYYAGKTRITDLSLEILARMDSLESIELWEIAGITDAGIAALAKLPNLREISVEDAPNVTRRGMSLFPPRVRVSY